MHRERDDRRSHHACRMGWRVVRPVESQSLLRVLQYQPRCHSEEIQAESTDHPDNRENRPDTDTTLEIMVTDDFLRNRRLTPPDVLVFLSPTSNPALETKKSGHDEFTENTR